RDRYEQGVRALIVAGIKARALRAADAVVATRAFLGALNWTAHWFRADGPHSAADVAALVADYAVAGLNPQRYERTHAHSADRQRRTGERRVRLVQDAPRGAA